MPEFHVDPQQIVVVFDVPAQIDRETAAETLVSLLVRADLIDRAQSGGHIESWWIADGDLKHVDRNDNDPMRLVLDEPDAEWTTEHRQFLVDVLTTGVEGGIGYWARVYDSERTEDGGWTKIVLVDHESVDMATIGAAPFGGWDALDTAQANGHEHVVEHTHTVTLEDVERAIQMLAAGKVSVHDDYRKRIVAGWTTDDADLDSIDCDIVIQVAALGEVVYS